MAKEDIIIEIKVGKIRLGDKFDIVLKPSPKLFDCNIDIILNKNKPEQSILFLENFFAVSL